MSYSKRVNLHQPLPASIARLKSKPTNNSHSLCSMNQKKIALKKISGWFGQGLSGKVRVLGG